MGIWLPLERSLGRGGFAVNLLISGAGFAGRPAAAGESKDADDADPAALGEGDDAADANCLAGFLDPLAVDPRRALVDQRLGLGTAFRQPDAVEVEVDPQARPD